VNNEKLLSFQQLSIRYPYLIKMFLIHSMILIVLHTQIFEVLAHLNSSLSHLGQL